MKTGSKITLATICLVVIAIGAVLFYVITNLDSIVESAIEKYGSEATQTAVRVDNVKITLKDGAAAINGLTVANPAGFDAKYAFSVAKIGNKINLDSLGQEVIIIDDITIRGPKINYEMNKERKTNLNKLKNNLLATAQKTSSKKQQSKEDTKEPKLILKRVHFTEGEIHARVAPLNKEYNTKLPEILLRNLGGSKGSTPTQLSKEIIEVLIDRALAEVKKQGIDAELDKIKASAKEKIETKIKEKAGSKEDLKNKAADKLKGLLGK